MNRLIVGLIAALAVSACSESAMRDTTVAPSSLGAGLMAVTTPGISCSDATPTWITQNYGPNGNSATVLFNGEDGPGYTYEVVVEYNRSGVEPLREVARFKTNRTEVRINNTEDGGRYYVRVRITHNPCGDVAGSWSQVLTIYFDGRGDNVGKPPEEPPCFYAFYGGDGCYPQPPDDDDDEDSDDDDGNNGHGNDDDHDDDSNPGNDD